MSDFKSRLLEERDQLKERVTKLDTFLDSQLFEEISELQQNLLQDQFECMLGYLDCLELRIEDLDKN